MFWVLSGAVEHCGLAFVLLANGACYRCCLVDLLHPQDETFAAWGLYLIVVDYKDVSFGPCGAD